MSEDELRGHIMEIKGQLKEHENRSQDWKDFMLQRDKHQEELIKILQQELKDFRSGTKCKVHDFSFRLLWGTVIGIIGWITKSHFIK